MSSAVTSKIWWHLIMLGLIYLASHNVRAQQASSIAPTPNGQEAISVSLADEFPAFNQLDVTSLNAAFEAAAAEFGVPAALLKAVAWQESRWAQAGPTIDVGWGVMHLVDNDDAQTLKEAATLLGVSIEDLQTNTVTNIRGAAALIASYADKPETLDGYFEALKKFTGLQKDVQASQALEYYRVLNEGVDATNGLGMTVQFDAVAVDMDLLKAQTSKAVTKSSDYGPAIWNAASSSNYTSGRSGYSIHYWVNHWIGSGTYAGAISWFKNSAASVSAHFVIRQSDGELTQMVALANTAWHATNWSYNCQSIGIEHEATPSNPWPTSSSAPMLVNSAACCRTMCDTYGIAKTRSYIIGHNEVPGTSTACPGDLPWGVYMALVNGSSGAPTMKLLGKNDISISDGDTSPGTSDGTDFGTIEEETTSPAVTFTIQNTGTANLNLTGSPCVQSSNRNDFLITQQPSASIAPGASTTFKVVFEPISDIVGSETATITIPNNDPNHNPFDFAVRGTVATSRVIDLEGNMDFGAVSVGNTAQRTLTIYNDGNSTLTVSSISYPSGFSGNWSSGTISANGCKNVTVTFSPSSAQSYGGTITVNSDKTSGTNTISCSGTGTATATRIIDLDGNLSFGSVTVGLSTTKTLTIYNDGNSTLTVSGINYPSGFSGNWSSGTISANSYKNVTVTFSPSSAQSYGGTITVNSDKTSGTNTISCSGTGTTSPTRIIRLAGDLSFGSVTVGSSTTKTLTIYNDGNSTLTVSSINYPSGFNGNWSSGTISANGYKNVTVTFSPSATQSYGGTITVNSDKTSGTNTISCSGTATATATRIIDLDGDLSFGSVTVGSSTTRTLSIYNDGNSTLTVSSINYPNGFSGNWSSGTISANGCKNVTVTFSPSSAQSYGGTITVNSDKTSGTNTISCSGTGTTSPTRIIRLAGDLSFGTVTIGSSTTKTLTIYNDGNIALTISSISYPNGFSGNWNSGTISANGSKNITVTFVPTEELSYDGMITVNSDALSGVNSIRCFGVGIPSTADCVYLLSSSEQSFSANGGSEVFQVSTSCDWTAVADASWIVVYTSAGTGDATIGYSVLSNDTQFSRTGYIALGNNSYTIYQAASELNPPSTTCTYTLSASSVSLPAEGGSGLLTVTAPSSCTWYSLCNAEWLTITSAETTGNGTISYTASPNPDVVSRTAVIIVADQTFTVTQAAQTSYNEDQCPNDPLKTSPGICGCGVPDLDSDGDAVLDCVDSCLDTPAGAVVDAQGCSVSEPAVVPFAACGTGVLQGLLVSIGGLLLVQPCRRRNQR